MHNDSLSYFHGLYFYPWTRFDVDIFDIYLNLGDLEGDRKGSPPTLSPAPNCMLHSGLPERVPWTVTLGEMPDHRDGDEVYFMSCNRKTTGIWKVWGDGESVVESVLALLSILLAGSNSPLASQRNVEQH